MLNLSGNRLQSEPQITITDLDPLSVSFWGVISGGTGNGTNIIDVVAGNNLGWAIIKRADEKLELRIERDSEKNLLRRNFTATSETDLLHHAVTWDGGFATSSVRWWINGIEDTTDGNLGLGSHNSGTATDIEIGEAVGGDVCDLGWLAIWNRLLHDAEVRQLANRRSPLYFPNALVAYWRWNESSQAVVDRVGGMSLRPIGLGTPPFVLHDIDIVDPAGLWVVPGAAATDLPDADTVFLRRKPKHRRDSYAT